MNRDGEDVTKIIQGTRPAWSPQGEQLLYDADKHIYRLDMNSGGKTLLSRDGFDADWFDPATLSVQPSAKLLTTVWGHSQRRSTMKLIVIEAQFCSLPSQHGLELFWRILITAIESVAYLQYAQCARWDLENP